MHFIINSALNDNSHIQFIKIISQYQYISLTSFNIKDNSCIYNLDNTL
jgi:hypothetical protein